MVEKPLATSLAEAEQLVALARARGAVLQVGHIERFNPALSALDGLPLRPKYIAAERLSTYTFRSTDIGVVLDLMIHDLDLVLSLVAAPVRVGRGRRRERLRRTRGRRQRPDRVRGRLRRQPDGQPRQLLAVRKMRIWGAEGYATLDFAARQGTLVRPSEQLRRGRLDLKAST